MTIQKVERETDWPQSHIGKLCLIHEYVKKPDTGNYKFVNHQLYINNVNGYFHNVSEKQDHFLDLIGCAGFLVCKFKKGETLTTGRLRFYDPNLWPESEDQIMPLNMMLDMHGGFLDWVGANILHRWSIIHYMDGTRSRIGVAFRNRADAALCAEWIVGYRNTMRARA